MRSAINSRNTLKHSIIFILSGLLSPQTQAIDLNFSAVLTSGTCTFDLDKNTLQLGRIHLKEMAASTLKAVQPFTLTVSRCTGSVPGLIPVVYVSGEGINQAGKWLFRSSAGSTATGMGVMLVKSDTPPDYSYQEVENDSTFKLAASGAVPTDQDLQFYAGLTCGNATTCSTATAGIVTARIIFKLDFN